MHLRKINAATRLYLIFAVIFVVLLLPAKGQPQALNLNGLIAVDYYSTVTHNKTRGQEAATGTTSNLVQRYIISGSGDILSPNFSSYSASIGLTNSTYNNNPPAGESTKINRNTLTYGLQMNLIPTITPITLFAQRNVIGSDNGTDLIYDTYSLSWSANIRTRTYLRATLLQIGTQYDDPKNPRDTRIRIANIGLTQNLNNGFVSASYQFTDSLVRDKKLGQNTSSKVYSYSIRGENRLSPTLFVSGNATYFPKGSFSTPGVTVTPETAGELGLLNQTEMRLTQAVNYTFRKAEGGGTRRDVVSYTMNYNPLGKTDYRTDVLYSSTNSIESNANEYRITGGINHRPFYGLAITTNMVLNHLDVTAGTTENRTDRVGALAGINYYTLLDMFNLNTNYTADVSYVFSNQAEAEGGIITQVATVGLASRNLVATQILTSYSFLHRDNYIVKGENRQEQSVHFEVRHNYTRRVLLQAAANYSNVLHYGDTFIFDSRAEYSISAGTGVAAGYKFSNFPSATNSQDSQLFFVEAIHQRYLTRRLSMNLTAHGEREELRYTEKNKGTLTAALNYMVGKITINLEFREDYTKYPESVYNIQSYFVKASRPF